MSERALLDDLRTLSRVAQRCVAREEAVGEALQGTRFARLGGLGGWTPAADEANAVASITGRAGQLALAGWDSLPPRLEKPLQDLAQGSPQGRSLAEHLRSQLGKPLGPQTRADRPKRPAARKAKARQPAPPPPETPPKPRAKRWRGLDHPWQNERVVTLWLDEAWDSERPGFGMIAGLIQGGEGTLRGQVDPVPQHLLQDHGWREDRNLQRAARSIEQLASTPGALAFGVRFRVEDGERAQQRYRPLLYSAIFLALGWLLPEPSHPTLVRVRCDNMGRFVGDGTEHLRGAFEQAQMHSPRLDRWVIHSLRWLGKKELALPSDGAYLGLADMINYLLLRPKVGRKVLERAGVEALPRQTGLDLQDWPMLQRLDALPDSLAVGELVDFLSHERVSLLGKRVVSDLVPAFARAGSPLPDALVDELVKRLHNGDQSALTLHRALGLLAPLLPSASPKPRLDLALRLVRLQDANHRGNPSDADAVLEGWEQAWQAGSSDRGLAVLAELSRAVNRADRFDFDGATDVVMALARQPWFEHMNPQLQGRVKSAPGQYLSMTGERALAEDAFAEALGAFESLPPGTAERGADLARTSTYRVINAMDSVALRGSVPDQMRALFDQRDLKAVARSLASDGPGVGAWRHHAFLRWLWAAQADTEELCGAYLRQRRQWRGADDHPWPLIGLYRGLLLSLDGHLDDARAAIKQAVDRCDVDSVGGPIRLIGAVIAAVAAIELSDAGFVGRARTLAKSAETRLPELAPQAAAVMARVKGVRGLTDNQRDDAIDGVMELLPFNYR